MATSLTHRGPDSGDVFVDVTSGLALAHRRLSIIDLSVNGSQPMRSSNGRYTLVYNGEIYNFSELRLELEKAGGPHLPWRGTSDTEVMLAAIEHWGVEEAIARFVGMFAFALWDAENRILTLVRDRLGEKPLYYAPIQGGFLFGSELKALQAHPLFAPQLDYQSLALYLRFQYVPSPRTIFRDVWKLEPGHLVVIDGKRPAPAAQRPYWSLRDVVNRAMREPFDGSIEEAERHLESLLMGAIAGQSISDVPLGSLLSGGIDSSLITALMQAQSSVPVRSFTIGYDDPAYDEARYSREVARHLGTDHTELVLSPGRALELIPRLPEIYDEPFADASMLPTCMVAELTRKHVSVCLSGDGGDETFAGYNRHFLAPRVWSRLSRLPAAVSWFLARAITSVPPSAYDSLYRLVAPFLPQSVRISIPGSKLHKLAETLNVPSREALYKQLATTWSEPTRVLAGVTEPSTVLDIPDCWPGTNDFTSWMQFVDSVTYLPHDIMTKVDRATMAFSLESRAPYLDHRVVEFAWRLPLSMKIHRGQGKRILRNILYRHVPRELLDRPKIGFGVPIDTWLRGPLRRWAEELLSENRLTSQDIFNVPLIRAEFETHMSGRRDNQYRLWNILMFQAWFDRWN